VSPVKYELGFISQKTTFLVTTVKTSNLTKCRVVKCFLLEVRVRWLLFLHFARMVTGSYLGPVTAVLTERL
jgi:hypothetical protein